MSDAELKKKKKKLSGWDARCLSERGAHVLFRNSRKYIDKERKTVGATLSRRII